LFTLLQKKVLQPTVKKTEDLLPNGFGNCKKSKTVCVILIVKRELEHQGVLKRPQRATEPNVAATQA
jgi:hypothetical protein